VDYILRITYWIWHEKKVDLCLKYYSPKSILHTMTGDIFGNEPVVTNTWATLKSFPDRTLDGENVVWSCEGPSTYYTSHLIVSRMTNLGDSEWGPATNKRARIRTIADCICKNNVVVEEWLMRDNALLVMTMGYNVQDIAKKQALDDHKKGFNVIEFLKPERERILNGENSDHDVFYSRIFQENFVGFAKALFKSLWEEQDHDKVKLFYDFRVSAHLPSGRELYGTLELKEYLDEFQAAFTGIRVSVDHVACIPYLGEANDVAVRWSLTALHAKPSTTFGDDFTETPIYILGSSHFRIMRGKIREEWTVFDELAIHRQIATGKIHFS